MERRYLYALAILAVLAVGIVNATVFAYRWITGTVRVAGPTEARGVACTGFYSSATQQGITLPPAGTNHDAPTYGGNRITVTPGHVVCQWSVGGTTYYLYESITVTIPVTVGSWYLQDIYGFGYNGTPTCPTVHVYFRVDEPVSPTGVLTEAKLIVYKGGEAQIRPLNLLMSGDMIGPITLSPGEALRLDLKIDAGAAGEATFKVGVYVTQEYGESPLSPTP